MTHNNNDTQERPDLLSLGIDLAMDRAMNPAPPAINAELAQALLDRFAEHETPRPVVAVADAAVAAATAVNVELPVAPPVEPAVEQVTAPVTPPVVVKKTRGPKKDIFAGLSIEEKLAAIRQLRNGVLYSPTMPQADATTMLEKIIDDVIAQPVAPEPIVLVQDVAIMPQEEVVVVEQPDTMPAQHETRRRGSKLPINVTDIKALIDQGVPDRILREQYAIDGERLKIWRQAIDPDRTKLKAYKVAHPRKEAEDKIASGDQPQQVDTGIRKKRGRASTQITDINQLPAETKESIIALLRQRTLYPQITQQHDVARIIIQQIRDEAGIKIAKGRINPVTRNSVASKVVVNKKSAEEAIRIIREAAAQGAKISLAQVAQKLKIDPDQLKEYIDKKEIILPTPPKKKPLPQAKEKPTNTPTPNVPTIAVGNTSYSPERLEQRRNARLALTPPDIEMQVIGDMAAIRIDLKTKKKGAKTHLSDILLTPDRDTFYSIVANNVDLRHAAGIKEHVTPVMLYAAADGVWLINRTGSGNSSMTIQHCPNPSWEIDRAQVPENACHIMVSKNYHARPACRKMANSVLVNHLQQPQKTLPALQPANKQPDKLAMATALVEKQIVVLGATVKPMVSQSAMAKQLEAQALSASSLLQQGTLSAEDVAKQSGYASVEAMMAVLKGRGLLTESAKPKDTNQPPKEKKERPVAPAARTKKAEETKNVTDDTNAPDWVVGRKLGIEAGKRNKAGNQLRVREAQKWLQKGAHLADVLVYTGFENKEALEKMARKQLHINIDNALRLGKEARLAYERKKMPQDTVTPTVVDNPHQQKILDALTPAIHTHDGTTDIKTIRSKMGQNAGLLRRFQNNGITLCYAVADHPHDLANIARPHNSKATPAMLMITPQKMYYLWHKNGKEIGFEACNDPDFTVLDKYRHEKAVMFLVTKDYEENVQLQQLVNKAAVKHAKAIHNL